MNKLFLHVLLLSISISVSTQDLDDLERKNNETKEEYVLRVKSPEDTLTYKILESYEWDTDNPSIVCFYEVPKESENRAEIIGHVYMKQYDVNYYRDIVFGEFIGESLYPEIIDVFWLNIDDDKERELFVLFRYYTYHYDFTGYIYNLSVLDNPTFIKDDLSSIDLFNDTFLSFEGMSGDGIESFPLYTTKESVLKKLHELGY